MNQQLNILVVDDDPNILEVLCARLKAVKFNVFKASQGTTALEILKDKQINLMISDVKMPGMSGTELFEKAKKIVPDLPVIFLTAYGTIPDAVSALKQGAVDYVSKPFDGKELLVKINEILDKAIQGEEPKVLDTTENGFYWGNSLEMKSLRATIRKVAISNVNVMILGESGVGKECIAHSIHRLSPQKSFPCIVVDCGSTPNGILESELFGHMKGAFTHAVKDKQGLIEVAHKGTLFLDEIGNISQEMQSRLLRFLEDKKIRRVGALKETQIDCRVLSATNSDLVEEIDSGRFRQDLYFRLKGVTLHIPPLRKRKEDIPELSKIFIENYLKKADLPKVSIPDHTLNFMCEYHWPGNVRELKNCIEAAIILCRDNQIQPRDLQLEKPQKFNSAFVGNETGFSIEDSEKNTIIRALKQASGVQKNAADLLKISKRSMHYKIKKYKIEPLDYKI